MSEVFQFGCQSCTSSMASRLTPGIVNVRLPAVTRYLGRKASHASNAVLSLEYFQEALVLEYFDATLSLKLLDDGIGFVR